MAAPKLIEELIDKFDSDQEFYRSSQYNETELRTQFINPFFEALGWDVYHKEECRPDKRDVKEEDAIDVEGKTKNPDYSFRLFEKRKFFVEVKRPSINIESGVYPAYQIRRYAWSADLPISILTDFEEFSVYYCRARPSKDDKPTKSRLLYFRYDQYLEKWPEIEALFSRDAVLNGSLDKYVGSLPQKRGDKRVDAALLDDISEWREMLAKNIALRNPDLDTMSLNYAVQAIIDRIIFLRICEDRGIERYMRLKDLLNGERVYPRLCELFLQADERYNSGIFHFNKESGRDSPDNITPNLNIDDKTLKDIIKRLYFPESPYEFSVLPAEILGQIYEQFLGKVIRLTDDQGAVVEDKPEVKKAGGVKYTPSYIVEYIVGNTLGEMLLGKTPLETVPVSVLDPACGSGSFLIVAYQHLLDWHKEWYIQNVVPMMQSGQKSEIRRLLPGAIAKGKKGRAREPELPIFQGRGGEWRLTTAERKRILLNNIYGVDIDRQAVEVTKLSLLLKVLEGENEETISKQLTLFQERALPDLSNNIKCGNSLIGWDILNDNPGMGQEEIERINPFDWEKEFPEIMQAGGFYVVIGNPPYVDVKLLSANFKKHLGKRYRSAAKRFDLYIPFTQKGIELLAINGLFGFIMPSMFMRREYGSSLREVIFDLTAIEEIIDFGTNQIFNGPLNYVCICILRRSLAKQAVNIIKFEYDKLNEIEIEKSLEGEEIEGVNRYVLSPESFDRVSEWYLLDEIQEKATQKIFNKYPPIDNILLYASEGIHSGKDEVFFVPSNKASAFSLESPPFYPLAKGKDIHRYKNIDRNLLNHMVFYPYDLLTGKIIDDYSIEALWPNAWNYLVSCRDILKGRPYFDKSNKKWYELWCPRDPKIFTSPKIISPEITDKGNFTLSSNLLFINNKIKGITLKEDVKERIEYILGLLNSNLLILLYKGIAPPKGGNYFEVKTAILRRLPFRHINFSDPTDVARHDRMVSLVEQILSLHKQLPEARTPHEQIALQRQIEATDRQIDALVYELYGLTEEEIGIVEGVHG